MYKNDYWNGVVNGVTYRPCPITVFTIIVHNPGITLKEFYARGYSVIYLALEILKDEEKIFVDNGRYYPNN